MRGTDQCVTCFFSPQNSTLLPLYYFSEHCDYNVIRQNKLGGGSNGTIYPVYLQSDRSLKMAVKEVGGFFCCLGGKGGGMEATTKCNY